MRLKRYGEYDYSTDGSYRLVRYIDNDNEERQSASFYVERTEEDIELPYLKCYKHLGSQKVLVSMYQDEVTYEWISDTELLIDGRVKDIKKIFKQAELEKLKTEEEDKDETEDEVYLTYYEKQGVSQEEEEDEASGVKKPIIFDDNESAEETDNTEEAADAGNADNAE